MNDDRWQQPHIEPGPDIDKAMIEWQLVTLRDFFAAAALTGLVQRNDIEDAPIAAMKAYVVADEMLAAREGGQE